MAKVNLYKMDTPRELTPSNRISHSAEERSSDRNSLGNIQGDDTQPRVKKESPPLRLRRNIGLVAAVSYVAGGIIGVGIFVSPQMVLINTGLSLGLSFAVWVFCAIIAFCGALCYAEFGTRIRKSGGSYTYVREAWGDGAGFVFLWTQLVVVKPTATALGAMTVAEYTLRPVFLTCPQLTPWPAKVLLSLCILGLLVFLNAYSTRVAAAVQIWSTVCKLSALVVIIVIGIFFLIKNGGDNFQDIFATPKDLTIEGVTLAVYSCNYAYVGWDNICNATEEVKNPHRNIPLSNLLAVSVTTAVYLLALVSYHAVLTTSQIVSGLAVAAVFTEMTQPALMWLIVPCIAISAIGVVNVMIFVTTRMNFIGGRDGLFPEILSMVSASRKTPLVSCIVLGVAASVVILMADIQSVLGAYSLFRASGETAAILGLWRLRRRFPRRSGDFYRVSNVAPAVYLPIHLGLAVMAITRDTSRYFMPLLLALTGIPIYFLTFTRMCSMGPLKKLNDFSVDLCRKLLLTDFASKY